MQIWVVGEEDVVHIFLSSRLLSCSSFVRKPLVLLETRKLEGKMKDWTEGRMETGCGCEVPSDK